LGLVSPALKSDTLAYCLNDLQASMLITEAALVGVAAPAVRTASSVSGVVVSGHADGAHTVSLPGFVSFEAALHTGESAPPVHSDSIDIDLAAIIYTSGSMGQPKGVMLTHRNMLTAATSINAYLGNTQDDVVLCALPLSFDYGLYQMIMTFAVGGRLVLEPSFALLPRVVTRVQNEGVTAFPCLPTVCALLGEMTTLARFDLSSVRYVTVSGAAFMPKHRAVLARTFPRARIFSMFGLTECKRCSYLPPEDLDLKPSSVGIAIPNTELWLVDDAGLEVGPHQLGQLVIRGAHVMRGYWRDLELTAERLRPGKLPGEFVLYTGDLCTRDEDGYLYFVARMDDVIKCRGQKVPPREVEMALTDIPGVIEAAVIGVPDEIQGSAVKAFVVLRTDVTMTEDEVRRECRRRLVPGMVPHHVAFVPSLPRTATGKLDKSGLT
jgi:acyl-CoA synthetase (AMP-forming)/AMP-acid ligase II